MKDYECPGCNKLMIKYHNTLCYACDNCDIFIAEPGHYYDNKWAFQINNNRDFTIIKCESFEDCKRKWKLKTLW